MSKPVLLSTAYFPPVSWFAALLKSGAAHIEAQETYTKQTYRNRCRILGPNKLQILSVPVIKPVGNRSKTSEVLLVSGNYWKKIHWRALETAYNTSPFFLFYRDRIEQAVFKQHTHLLSLNQTLLVLLLELLEIKADIKFTSDFEKEPQDAIDMRNEIHPKKSPFPAKSFPAYTQVFCPKSLFIPDLSIIDLLFNEGPASLDYLHQIAQSIYPSTYTW